MTRDQKLLLAVMIMGLVFLLVCRDLTASTVGVGDEGQAIWRDGHYHPAKILKKEGNQCFIHWDMQDNESPYDFWQSCGNFVPQGQKLPPVGPCPPIQKDDEIMVSKQGKWLHARVLSNVEGNLQVRYDDGKEEAARNFRLPEFCPQKTDVKPPSAKISDPAIDPELASTFEMKEARVPSDAPRENITQSPDKNFRAFTSGDRLFVEDMKSGKSYEIKIEGLPRPFSNLKWSQTILSFDRWAQPRYRVHFTVDVAAKTLVTATGSFD